MASWSGFESDFSFSDISFSLTRSPFSAAFNTSRLSGILTNGVREVLNSVREYLEDLYNAL
jgi:hypothetical protein